MTAEAGRLPDAGRTRVAVAVCTCDRNGPLAVLLDRLVANAQRVAARAAVAVVVVDDARSCSARDVASRYQAAFELGLHYRVAGRQNISFARNLAVDTAAGVADWVAMTDDDCEPEADWLQMLLEMQQGTGADAIGGTYRRRPPPGAPSWLTEEPFLDVALVSPVDGAEVSMAGTNNSMISAAWWRSHPHIRFPEEFGVAGGEDVVFYRTAHAAGLRIRAAARAVVFENEPAARATLRYQLWLFFWLGNSSLATRLQIGEASALRMFLQGGNRARKALIRPIARIVHGHRPQMRYCAASALFAAGMMLGALGLRVAHH